MSEQVHCAGDRLSRASRSALRDIADQHLSELRSTSIPGTFDAAIREVEDHILPACFAEANTRGATSMSVLLPTSRLGEKDTDRTNHIVSMIRTKLTSEGLTTAFHWSRVKDTVGRLQITWPA